MSTTDARGHKFPEGTDPAARQSLLDLSLSIPSIRARPSAATATQHVQALAAAGQAPSAEAPAYVYRTDLGALTIWDGGTWRSISAIANGQVAPLSGWTGKTVLLLARLGRVVTMAGTIARSGFEVITPVQYEIGTIPAGFRPSAAMLTLGTTLYLSAVSYVHGGTPAADAIVQVRPAGDIWVRPARASSSVTVNASWITD